MSRRLRSRPQGEVDRPQQRRDTKHERKVEAGCKANQPRQGTGFVRGDAATRDFADAAVSDVTGNKPKVLMFSDRSRAYMHARTTSDMYVELCEEDKSDIGDVHRCGKLVKSMYGTRAASRDWPSEVRRTNERFGISIGQSISVRVPASAKRRQSAGTRGRIRINPAKGRNSSGGAGACW